jgi:MFS family permease
LTKVKALSAQTFRSLHVRNYRLFVSGQLVSMTGTWAQSVAQAWLVLKLTGSGFAVGFVTALQFVPTLLGGAWGGVIADRVDKRKALVATQAAMAGLAAVLAAVTATGAVRLWMVYVLVFLLGCATVVDTPTRQAFVSEMVGPDDLANAVGLNSAMFNAARVFGPASAGLVIARFGVWPCFAVNAVSFVAVIGALAAMRPSELRRGAPVRREPGQVRAGLRYAWASQELRSTLLLVAVVGTFALNFNVVLPLLARFTFHGGAGAFGLLTSTMGAGSLVGALYTAARGRPTPRLLVVSCLAVGVLMLAAAAAPTLGAELVLLPLVGAATMAFMATANSTLQLGSSPAMRGRVMALYVLVFLGSTPIGGPLVGWVSGRFGPRVGLGLGGVGSILAAAGALSVLRARAGRRGAVVEPIPTEPAAA